MTREADSLPFASLEQRLGYRFRDRALLRRALTHRSWAHEQGVGEDSYERLEFLGDSLLGFLVAHRLWIEDPEASEGTLSRRKQAVVRTETLAAGARALGLGGALRLGRGEERSGGRAKASLLADVFEAVLAAVYLDGGVRAARPFVRRHLGAAIRRAGGFVEIADDFKTRLQERAQARLHHTPAYRIVRRSGSDHAPEFVAEVRVCGRLLGRGRGASRKLAEQSAARQAFEAWSDERESLS